MVVTALTTVARLAGQSDGKVMSIITAFLLTSGYGGYDNPLISVNLNAFDETEIIGWPPSGSLPALGFTQTVINNLPVSTTPRLLPAFMPKAYLHDYYFRIHITPASIDLGNISSTQGVNVLVWNAWLTPQTLNSFSGAEEGIEVTPPRPLPLTFGALEENLWGILVSSTGTPQIDINIEFDFAGIDSPVLHITGTRVTMWPFLPDWSESITQRMEWATDILTSNTGTEQRRALRLSPRRFYSGRFLLFKADRPYFDMLMAGNGAGTFAIPIWPEMQELKAAVQAGDTEVLCNTAQREFIPGGMVVLRTPDVNDIFTLETIIIKHVFDDHLVTERPLQQSWPSGTRLYPARSCRLSSQPKVERITDQDVISNINFEINEASDWQAELPATLYRGFPVFEARPDENKNLTTEYLRILQTLDNVAGIPAVYDNSKQPFSAQEHAFFLVGAEEVDAFKRFMYALRGRQVSVWVPTHMSDMQVAAVSSNNRMIIQKMGYAQFGVGRVGRRDIRLERKSGLVTMHRIEAAVDLQDGTEQIQIDPPLLDLVFPDDVGRISFMALCRLDSDSVELEHAHDIETFTRASVVWRSLKDETEG